MGPETLRRDAIASAVDAGVEAGLDDTDPVVLHDTNNVVIWLRPHQIVAKVGVQPHSTEVLGRDVAVCGQLAASGAPVATSLGSLRSAGPHRWPVSLWKRIESLEAAEASSAELAVRLARVHAGLDACSIALPSYVDTLNAARMVLADDTQLSAVSAGDRQLLRDAFDDWAGQAKRMATPDRHLHGDPHPGNWMVTASGPVLIDFEAASTGPVEWDICAMPPQVADEMNGIDTDLLRVLRPLRSAVVATWCWARSDIPGMRAHAEHHLGMVRAARR